MVPQLENVYLHDVDAPAFLTEVDFDKFGRTNGWFEWFSQGLTPQEFTAPMKLEFFNNSWVSTGSRWNLMTTLQDNTRIPKDILSDGQVLRSTGLRKRPCAAHVISWAADWKTKRLEDRTHSLLSLFGVNMPVLYGEVSRASQRLQVQVIRVSSDHSIFAWNPRAQFGEYESVLADDPSRFRGRQDIEKLPPKVLYQELTGYMHLMWTENFIVA